ncbi:hypothetical protein FQA39_LY06080 [Lamprigera yunnana]|nr:hypothetical protein FQA39_LY06080 [Lamprigera yunnana]
MANGKDKDAKRLIAKLEMLLGMSNGVKSELINNESDGNEYVVSEEESVSKTAKEVVKSGQDIKPSMQSNTSSYLTITGENCDVKTCIKDIIKSGNTETMVVYMNEVVFEDILPEKLNNLLSTIDISKKYMKIVIADNAIPAFRFYRSTESRFLLEALSETASALNADNSDIEYDVAETTSADIGDCDLWVPEDEEEDKENEEEDEENVENKISDSEIEASGNSRRTNKAISNLKCKKYVM